MTPTETIVWLTTAGEYGPLAAPRKEVIGGEIKSSVDGGYLTVLKVQPAFSDAHLSPPAVSETYVLASKVIGRSYSLRAESVLSVFAFDSPMLVQLYRALNIHFLTRAEFGKNEI